MRHSTATSATTVLSRAASSILGFLVAASLSTTSQAQTAAHRVDTVRVSVGDAVRLALEVSPEVAERSARADFATARAGQAKASRFLSQLSVTTAHSLAPGVTNPNGISTEELYLDPEVRNDWDSLRPFNRAEANLVQPIFTWGELSSTIRAANAGIEVELASMDEKTEEVAGRTTRLYYDLLLTSALERLTTEAGAIVDRAKREIRRLLDEGAEGVDDADLFQVLITEQEFNRRVVEVSEKQSIAQAAIRRQLFLEDHVVVEVADESLEMLAFSPDSLEWYQSAAISHRPELRKGVAGFDARNALVSVAQSGLYPKLFIGARYSIAYTGGRFRQPNPYVGDRLRGQSFEAGFGFRQSLNFSQVRAKVRQAEAERDQVRFQLDAGRQLILFEVEQAYREVRVARAAVEAQEEALRISREWLQTESINFDLDLGDTENLVKAVQANLTLQASRHEAVRNFNVAVVELLQSTGMLASGLRDGTLVDFR